VLQEILDDDRMTIEIQKLKLNAALEALSRAGYGPVKQVRVEQSSLSIHLTAEEIEEIKRRAREELGQCEPALDVEYEEIKGPLCE
jgi:hypothetical protein